MSTISRRLPGLALLLTLAGCGGGGATSAPGAPAAPAAPTSVAGSVVLTIPARSASGGRGAAFVSPSADSALVVVTVNSQSVASFTFDVSPTSPNCTGSGTARTCTLAVSAPPGADGFVVALTDNSNGKQLGISSGTAQVTAGTPWTLALVIDPVPGSIVSSAFAPSTFSIGTPGTSTLTPVLADPSGNTIPANSAPLFAPPPTFASSDPHVTVTNALLKPGDAVTVGYDGSAAVATPVTLTVTAAGKTVGTITVPFATVGPVVLSPSRFDFSFPGQTSTVTATQTGNPGNTFTFTPIGCPGPGSASIVQLSPGTFQVTANSPSTGVCTATITGLGGQTATFSTLI